MTNNMIIRNNVEVLTYEDAINQVKKVVDRSLTKSPLLIREYLSHLSLSQGKFIRAVSVIVSAQDNEGMVDPNAVNIAAAIEIIHLASLVHDDVIDNAKLRRGKATLQEKYGKKTAVICGDYLLSLALRMISDISNKKNYLELELPDYIGKLCLGELNQYINNNNVNLSIFKYLKIISGKTAALFEASFFAGAVMANCSEKETIKYKQFGYYIGMIFQLSDDCIDFDTTVEQANKPVQSDYEQGVITLPLIHAFMQNKKFKEKALEDGITREEINAEVNKTEGLSFTKLMIQKYYKKAMKRLDELTLCEDKKEKMVSILNKAARMTPAK